MKRWTLFCLIMANCALCYGIKCFQCDNKGNPACGESFKSYQFPADNCPGKSDKCGLQRQQKKGNFVGIIRACYPLGSMGLEDESDGCQEIMLAAHNITYSFCLCSKDYCNNFTPVSSSVILTYLSACLSLMMFIVRAHA